MSTALDLSPETTHGVVPIPFSKFTRDLMAEYTPPVVARSTSRTMAALLKALSTLPITEQQNDGTTTTRTIETTADLTLSTIAAYLAARPPETSPYTLRGNLAMISAICTRAEAYGYLRVSPFKLRKITRWIGPMPPPGNGKKRHCPREELRRILDLAAADVKNRSGWAQWRARRLWFTLAVAIYCGLRRDEILRMHAGDIDVAARILWIRPHGKKLKTGAAAAPIAIPRALLPIIVEWLAHRLDAPYGYPMPEECAWAVPTMNRKAPWVSGGLGGKALHRLQALAKRAGIESISWQMLRRSCATHLEYHGCGRALIKRILRHTNEKTSEVFYSESDIPNLLSAVDGFDF